LLSEDVHHRSGGAPPSGVKTDRDAQHLPAQERLQLLLNKAIKGE